MEKGKGKRHPGGAEESGERDYFDQVSILPKLVSLVLATSSSPRIICSLGLCLIWTDAVCRSSHLTFVFTSLMVSTMKLVVPYFFARSRLHFNLDWCEMDLSTFGGVCFFLNRCTHDCLGILQ